MALSAGLTPLVIALTQGGADAFVQSSVLTGLTGRQAYNVKAIWIDFPAGDLISAVAGNMELTVTITRRSKTAEPLLTDSDVIFRRQVAFGITTSGKIVWEATSVHYPTIEIPIVEETIYAQLDSTNTALTNIATVRLDVELDTMSDIDRLNLITRSLT